MVVVVVVAVVWWWSGSGDVGVVVVAMGNYA